MVESRASRWWNVVVIVRGDIGRLPAIYSMRRAHPCLLCSAELQTFGLLRCLRCVASNRRESDNPYGTERTAQRRQQLNSSSRMDKAADRSCPSWRAIGSESSSTFGASRLRRNFESRFTCDCCNQASSLFHPSNKHLIVRRRHCSHRADRCCHSFLLSPQFPGVASGQRGTLLIIRLLLSSSFPQLNRARVDWNNVDQRLAGPVRQSKAKASRFACSISYL